jgi:heme exporter protein B
MFRDAWAVFAKDLRIEAKTRVGLWQVLPFAVIALVTFAFALGPAKSALSAAAAGMCWVGVAFSSVLVVGRSQGIEREHGVRTAQRLAGIDPAGVFLGKTGAVAVQLAVIEIVLGLGAMGLLGYHVHRIWLLLVASVLATVGLAAVGTIYGALTGAARARETLLPMLVLPIVIPVLIAGVRCWQAASVSSAPRVGEWLSVLGAFAVIYIAAGVVLYGQIEEVQ